MNTTKLTHTPGPWRVALGEKEQDCNGYPLTVIDNDGREVMPQFHSFVEDVSEQTANVRLIAAAPELLEALNNLLNEDNTANRWNAQKAIAKAKGM